MNYITVKLEMTMLFFAIVRAGDAQSDQEEKPFSFLWLVVSIIVLATSATIIVITVLLCYFFVCKSKCTAKQQYSDEESQSETTMACISESIQPSHHLLLYTQWFQDTQEESTTHCAYNSMDTLNER